MLASHYSVCGKKKFGSLKIKKACTLEINEKISFEMIRLK